VRLTIPSLPFRIGAFSVGVSAHYGENDILMPERIIGVLQVVGPPIQTAARGDAGLIHVPAMWVMQSEAMHTAKNGWRQ
jgi:hypothetical protein